MSEQEADQSWLSKVAWQGELVLLEAKWNDKDGHLVKFKIAKPDEDKPNPFKQYTKRRAGKAGTIFHASMSYVQGPAKDEPDYNGELMLAGWGDTSTQGYTVTFWCEPPEQGMHAFDGYPRARSSFMTALVELDDDHEPVDQTARQRVERAHEGGSSRPHRRRTLSQDVAMMCNNPMFWGWINTQKRPKAPVTDGNEAAAWLRSFLGVRSRRELDQNRDLARDFHDRVRIPFVEWQEK